MHTSIRARGAFLGIAVLVLITALTMSSCGGGGGGKKTPPPPPVTTGSFKLTNSSGYTINQVYVALSSSSAWGSQQNSSTISNGSSWTLTNITPNTYDMRAVVIGTYSTYYTYKMGFAVTADNTYSVTAYLSGFTGSMFLYNNNATYQITDVRISPASSATWGSNQITSNIGTYGTREIVNIPSGSYDVRITRNAAYVYSYGNSIGSIAYTNISM